MYARQRTARRCYLRRLLGCFRHSGRSLAVLRIVLILMRQRTARRCYLRRLAPLVRPPQPPKIDFVDNSRASAKCSSENRAGRSLRPAEARYCSRTLTRELRRLLPEYIINGIATLRGSRTLKSHKNSPKTRKITKKACKLLYDTIICTTFGASDPSKCDVNRVVATGKREKFTVCGNKRMSRRVVTTLRLVSTSNALRHDGRGPLVL